MDSLDIVYAKNINLIVTECSIEGCQQCSNMNPDICLDDKNADTTSRYSNYDEFSLNEHRNI